MVSLSRTQGEFCIAKLTSIIGKDLDRAEEAEKVSGQAVYGANVHLTRRRLLRISAVASVGLLGSFASSPLRQVFGLAETSRLPIEHVILIFRENHSYDNYFATFLGGNGKTTSSRCDDETLDPPHGRRDALFGVIRGPRGNCHYVEQDIPNYFAYAREFVLCDNYFADIRGPSHPNYIMLMAAQTPSLDNISGELKGKYEMTTIADRLSDKGVSWKNYNGGIALVALFKNAVASGNIVPLAGFTADALGGKLPAMSGVTPSLRDSEHAPYSVKRGENWTVAKVNAVMQGPLWPKCAIFIVYDEWGGFWDHVTPPAVEGSVRYGYRIPCLILSPYAKRGFVSHTLYSHLSVLRTIERLFDVAPLNELDAKANDLLDCFDFQQEPRAPLILKERPG
jgi:phospholipase C